MKPLNCITKASNIYPHEVIYISSDVHGLSLFCNWLIYLHTTGYSLGQFDLATDEHAYWLPLSYLIATDSFTVMIL